MPAVRWSPRLVYVLVPEEGASERQVLLAGARACRVALQHDLLPICPQLYYASLLTPEEKSIRLPREARSWFRSCSSIWLVFPLEEEDLDRLAYNLLRENERCRERRPVYQLAVMGDAVVPVVMARQEVRSVLQCNLSVGFACAAVAV